MIALTTKHTLKDNLPVGHVAILRKSSGLLERIYTFRRKENWITMVHGKVCSMGLDLCRWCDILQVCRNASWSKSKSQKGKAIFRSESGKSQCSMEKYGKQIGITNLRPHIESTKHKKYCILIYLEQAQKIHWPFAINKTGFGNTCAWLIVRNIDSVIANALKQIKLLSLLTSNSFLGYSGCNIILFYSR